MTEPLTSTERSTNRRTLQSAGYVHASGWINERDKPVFDRMVAEAKDGVDMIVKQMEKGDAQ